MSGKLHGLHIDITGIWSTSFVQMGKRLCLPVWFPVREALLKREELVPKEHILPCEHRALLRRKAKDLLRVAFIESVPVPLQ